MTATATEYNTQHVALSPDEVHDWLDSWGKMPKVQSYLATGQPPYGVIVRVQQTADIYDDFLLFIPENPQGVWNPANLHIILVTGNPIVDSVNKAPYVSPDDTGFWDMFAKQRDDVFKGLGDIMKYAVIALVAIAAIQIFRK